MVADPEWLTPCLAVGQRLESRDHVEKLLVDAALAHPLECAAQVPQKLVDILLRPLHRREAARVLARKGFGAGSENRMFNQHAKWLKVTARLPWRRKME